MSEPFLVQEQIPGVVEAWSERRLPFEPRGDSLRFRTALRVALTGLVATRASGLRAEFASTSRDLVDAENVLFYNVGASAFARRSGFRVVRAMGRCPGTTDWLGHLLPPIRGGRRTHLAPLGGGGHHRWFRTDGHLGPHLADADGGRLARGSSRSGRSASSRSGRRSTRAGHRHRRASRGSPCGGHEATDRWRGCCLPRPRRIGWRGTLTARRRFAAPRRRRGPSAVRGVRTGGAGTAATPVASRRRGSVEPRRRSPSGRPAPGDHTQPYGLVHHRPDRPAPASDLVRREPLGLGHCVELVKPLSGEVADLRAGLRQLHRSGFTSHIAGSPRPPPPRLSEERLDCTTAFE